MQGILTPSTLHASDPRVTLSHPRAPTERFVCPGRQRQTPHDRHANTAHSPVELEHVDARETKLRRS